MKAIIMGSRSVQMKFGFWVMFKILSSFQEYSITSPKLICTRLGEFHKVNVYICMVYRRRMETS